ncbi:MAG: glycosyltransferase family 2 protein [Nitrospiraceae bacterium]|nr:glycosyltransferase family 2 protein [Nitrospiraceae bacterium]
MDSLSVIIPAYNEEARLASTVCRIHDYLKRQGREFEIIVVDDGSADGTAALARGLAAELGIKFIHNPVNSGKGFACKTGVMAARYGLSLICDADLSTPVEELEKMLPFPGQGCDIVIGSRALPGSDIRRRQPWYRQGMGKTFNLLVRLILFGGIRDTQCGFKLFRTDVAKELFGAGLVKGFSFDVEILYLARLSGRRIKEVPVRWTNEPNSRVRLFRDPARMFAELIKIRGYRARGKYRI